MPPLTAQVPGAGTTSLSYTIPGDGLDVESVYASIDATAAGGAVTAELTITDQSGVVIARKVQGATVAAGGTGSATWALRLDDETAATGGGGITQITSADSSVTITSPFGPNTNLAVPRPTTGTEILADTGEPLTAGSSYQFGWTHSTGPTLVNLAIAQRLKVPTAGWYAFRGRVNSGDAMADGDVWRLFMGFYTAAAAGIDTAVQVLAAPTAMFPDVFIQGVSYLPVNGFVTLDIQNQAAATNFTVAGSMAVNWINR